MSEPKRAFKGVWIPKALWEHPKLSWRQICLCAEIDSLDDDTGCYATNAFLAERFGCKEQAMANEISKLRKLNVIIDVTDPAYERKISLSPELRGSPKHGTPGSPKHGTPLNQNTEPPRGVPYKREKKEERVHDDVPSSSENGSPAVKENPFKELTDGWMAIYQRKFDGKYVFDGGRDGKAVKKLLETGLTVPRLLEMAEKAWDLSDKFLAGHSTTIHGFMNYFNQIQAQLSKTSVPVWDRY